MNPVVYRVVLVVVALLVLVGVWAVTGADDEEHK